MVVETTGAFDFWNLLVVNVFGGFWVCVAGMELIFFLILGFLGRVSVYSTILYGLIFLFAMTLGYGYTLFNLILGLIIIVALIYAINGYVNRQGQ